ncbi:PP2C family protein-serine/threonine phosphatase [Polyangium aurulentum]|uniref:PP2C family protein-serine/threonine phosphatase n=1 Tax=Polyangium aurulentum TaxID=2567896 RepID=UPI0010AE2115|nr:hypothetical protein [Polyangium aurulentum]UQA62805.1 hypothetical protein E8A73_021075 [Polyangium aurulentum]
MPHPFDIAGLCMESEPARSRHRAAMLVTTIEADHPARAAGALFELWDGPPSWFYVPSLDLQPSLAHALVKGADAGFINALKTAGGPEALGAIVRGTLEGAEQRLVALSAERDTLYAGSGAMAVAVVASAERLAIGWVGMARAYLVRGGVVEQLTTDHTMRNDALRGGLGAEIAAQMPADVQTRVLGMRQSGESTPVDIVSRDVQPGDWVVMVTQEVHRAVEIAEMGSAIAAAEDAEAAAALVMGRALGKSRGHSLGVVVMRRA